jgi:hypothetical protein
MGQSEEFNGNLVALRFHKFCPISEKILSSVRFAHEENFFEGSKLRLSLMLCSIFWGKIVGVARSNLLLSKNYKNESFKYSLSFYHL